MNKKVLALLLCILIFQSFLLIVHADNPLDWKKNGKIGQLAEVERTAGQVGAAGTSLVNLVGNIIGYIVLLLYGIKWWSSSGNAQARKELKDKSLDYVIGGVIFFGADFIYQIGYSIIQAFKG